MGVFSIGKVVVGSFFKKPSTLMYPVIPREWEERTRGAVAINVDGCVLCGACQRACPTNAIEVDRKASTWSIERMACIQCRGCVDNCPPKCLDMDPKYTEPGGEKIVDKFDIPPRKKAPKKDAPKKADADKKADAPKKDAKDAPKKEEAKKEAPAKEESKAEAAPAAAAAAAPAESGLVCDVESCVFCGACAEACPVSAIKVEDSTWEVDKDTCIECGACIDQCPAGCLSMAEAGAAPAEEAKAEEAPVKEEPKAEEKEAPKKEAAPDPKLEGYLADVCASLVKDFGLAEADAKAKLDASGLADQLKAFPYLMNKAAKEAAEKIK